VPNIVAPNEFRLTTCASGVNGLCHKLWQTYLFITGYMCPNGRHTWLGPVTPHSPSSQQQDITWNLIRVCGSWWPKLSVNVKRSIPKREWGWECGRGWRWGWGWRSSPSLEYWWLFWVTLKRFFNTYTLQICLLPLLSLIYFRPHHRLASVYCHPSPFIPLKYPGYGG